MNEVLLGMPGSWAVSNHEAVDHYTTKIGGLPDWPFPILSVKLDLLECNGCGSNLCLIAQVYAPISTGALTLEERVIYVFSCLTPHCESPVWRAIRVQKISSIAEQITPEVEGVNVPNSSCSISNKDLQDKGEESDDDIDLEELGRALFEAATLTSKGKKQNSEVPKIKNSRNPSHIDQPTRSIDTRIPVMPCFYIYTQKEKLSKRVSPESSKHRLLSMEESENDSKDDSNEETYEEESYEYDKALNADRTYLKFKKRMDLFPEQCFRYSYGGMPLLASKETGEFGNCRLCGGERHYEMQLMPPLIYFLQEAADEQQRLSLEKFNWMTLLVYTCSKSCEQSKGGYGSEEWVVAEEAVIVEHE